VDFEGIGFVLLGLIHYSGSKVLWPWILTFAFHKRRRIFWPSERLFSIVSFLQWFSVGCLTQYDMETFHSDWWPLGFTETPPTNKGFNIVNLEWEEGGVVYWGRQRKCWSVELFSGQESNKASSEYESGVNRLPGFLNNIVKTNHVRSIPKTKQYTTCGFVGLELRRCVLKELSRHCSWGSLVDLRAHCAVPGDNTV
jgi:hypothetical protein